MDVMCHPVHIVKFDNCGYDRGGLRGDLERARDSMSRARGSRRGSLGQQSHRAT